jgi:hypothetical protein
MYKIQSYFTGKTNCFPLQKLTCECCLEKYLLFILRNTKHVDTLCRKNEAFFIFRHVVYPNYNVMAHAQIPALVFRVNG